MKCSRCGTTDLDSFFPSVLKSAERRRRRTALCKACHNAFMSGHRAANRERYNRYDRERMQRNQTDPAWKARESARRSERYQRKKGQYRVTRNAAKRRYYHRHREQIRLAYHVKRFLANPRSYPVKLSPGLGKPKWSEAMCLPWWVWAEGFLMRCEEGGGWPGGS